MLPTYSMHCLRWADENKRPEEVGSKKAIEDLKSTILSFARGVVVVYKQVHILSRTIEIATPMSVNWITCVEMILCILCSPSSEIQLWAL